MLVPIVEEQSESKLEANARQQERGISTQVNWGTIHDLHCCARSPTTGREPACYTLASDRLAYTTQRNESITYTLLLRGPPSTSLNARS